MTDKDDISMNEYAVLSEYLSNCNFDKTKHHLELPNENVCEIPEGFFCSFYRVAEERAFEATVNGDCFTVFLSNQRTWDSDSSEKRHKEQVCEKCCFEALGFGKSSS